MARISAIIAMGALAACATTPPAPAFEPLLMVTLSETPDPAGCRPQIAYAVDARAKIAALSVETAWPGGRVSTMGLGLMDPDGDGVRRAEQMRGEVVAGAACQELDLVILELTCRDGAYRPVPCPPVQIDNQAMYRSVEIAPPPVDEQPSL